MRKIDTVVIHCSATPPTMDIGRKEIDEWHRARGWNGIGYHYVIRRNGEIENGREIGTVGAHVAGHNAHSVGICLVGGVDANNDPENNFEEIQFDSLLELLGMLKDEIPNEFDVVGHYELDPHKACPSFNVQDWLIQVVLKS